MGANNLKGEIKTKKRSHKSSKGIGKTKKLKQVNKKILQGLLFGSVD